MRANIVGQMSLDEMVREVTYFANCLREYGVQQVAEVNLDFSPHANGRAVELISDEGDVVNMVKLYGPSNRVYTLTYVREFSVDRSDGCDDSA